MEEIFMLIKNKELVKKKLDVYVSNFSYLKLKEYEDAIFGYIVDKRKRAQVELWRLETMMKKNQEFYLEYYCAYCRMKRLMKVAHFDPTALDEIYNTLLAIQLDNNINIRLYSGLPLLKEMIDLGMFA